MVDEGRLIAVSLGRKKEESRLSAHILRHWATEPSTHHESHRERPLRLHREIALNDTDEVSVVHGAVGGLEEVNVGIGSADEELIQEANEWDRRESVPAQG